MRIAIMGAGGVGGYYGAVLARRKHEVTFIARGVHLKAIQKNGLQVREDSGDFLIKPANATDKPADVGPVDLVLFCTKAYDAVSAAKAAKALVGPTTTVLSLQNGLDSYEDIGQVVGAQHMLAGATGIISKVDAPGMIRKVSDIAWVVLGELDGRVTPRAQAVCDAFKETGVKIEVSESIMVDLWTKLLIVAPLAGFGALTRLPIGSYRSVPETRALMTRLKREIVDLAAAALVTLEADVVEKTMSGIDELPLLWESSMQRDVQAGHRSELEAIIGVIGRKGRELGVPTPVADMIYGTLLPGDLKTRGQ
jgi:2-dehydropantoate 2-reductase